MNLFNRVIADNKVFQILNGLTLAAFVKVLLSPLQRLLDLLDAYIAAKRYELTFNGQICYLEHILNDKYDPILRRITITDPPQLLITPLSIFNIADEKPSILLYNLGDIRPNSTANSYSIADFTTQVDFILNIPNDLVTQQNAIKKTCDAYKEASKYYTINLI